MKILVAEDEKRMNRALCEILRLEKYEVDGVSDGEAALEAIAATSVNEMTRSTVFFR